ncbi:hypothetical protein V8C44DRAFT_19408 [Trichoderma aethiopicum]
MENEDVREEEKRCGRLMRGRVVGTGWAGMERLCRESGKQQKHVTYSCCLSNSKEKRVSGRERCGKPLYHPLTTRSSPASNHHGDFTASGHPLTPSQTGFKKQQSFQLERHASPTLPLQTSERSSTLRFHLHSDWRLKQCRFKSLMSKGTSRTRNKEAGNKGNGDSRWKATGVALLRLPAQRHTPDRGTGHSRRMKPTRRLLVATFQTIRLLQSQGLHQPSIQWPVPMDGKDDKMILDSHEAKSRGNNRPR